MPEKLLNFGDMHIGGKFQVSDGEKLREFRKSSIEPPLAFCLDKKQQVPFQEKQVIFTNPLLK